MRTLIILLLLPLFSFSQIKLDSYNSPNLDNYTHIAFVDLKDRGLLGRQIYKSYERDFVVVSKLKIINPFEIDGKLAQRDKFFLKKIKNEKWLYLDYIRDYAPGKSEIQTEITLKNYNEEVIYSASHYDMTVMETIFELNKLIN